MDNGLIKVQANPSNFDPVLPRFTMQRQKVYKYYLIIHVKIL